MAVNMAEADATTYLAPAEVEKRIHALTRADCVRLVRLGALYAAGTTWTPTELLQEAMVAALERRQWRADLNTTVFLVGVMKSLSYSKRKSQRTSALDYALANADRAEDESSYSVELESNNDPARLLQEEQQAASLLNQLDEYFADDAEVLRVIRDRIAGESPASTKTALGMNQRQYETVCRRLLRGYQNRIKVTQS
jgi:DNA-directed RNA polymerase specialized sigma24 family protein